MSGEFFRDALLFDSRFAGLAQLLGGMTPELFDRSALFLNGEAESFVEPAALRRLALALTAWTLLIEGVLAVAFLWPGRATRLGALRDAALLLFCATTFAVAPVSGFGWLLAAMGAAQSESARARLAYVGVFFLILVYKNVPWLEALASL